MALVGALPPAGLAARRGDGRGQEVATVIRAAIGAIGVGVGVAVGARVQQCVERQAAPRVLACLCCELNVLHALGLPRKDSAILSCVGWRMECVNTEWCAVLAGCPLHRMFLQDEVAACEGKETCILTRHLLRDDGDRVERGERRRATATDVVSNAKSLTSAHRRESRATRTARPVE